MTTVGFLCPSLDSRLTDFMVTAPAPLSATRFSNDLEVPRNPDGRIVGLDSLIPHKSVVRFGLVICILENGMYRKFFEVYQKAGIY